MRLKIERRSWALILGGLLFGAACRDVVPDPPRAPDAGLGERIARDSGLGSPADASAALDASDLAGDALAAPDAATPSDSGGSSTDGGTPEDASTPQDAGTASGCAEHRFELEHTTASTVWVTGSFTGWAPTPAEGALVLSRSGDLWSLTTNIESPGRHLYKFVIDGTTWIDDPANPDREDDGFGGFNSVLEICAGGGFEVLGHQTDSSLRSFAASVEYTGPADASLIEATLDLTPLPSGALSVSGSIIQIQLSGLSDGIHDLRLGLGADRTLLKIYVNESTDWRDALLYFVMTDRFRNGDPSNDAPVGGLANPLADYLGGDFAGVIQAIDDEYFDRLGVNALWISWPLDNAEGAWEGPYETFSGCGRTGQTTARFSGYHGYWPVSGRAIEPRFGTMDQLKDLVLAAHAHGIRVLLDFTSNHVHQDSPYFADHPGWFNQPALLCRDGHWDSDRKEECWFDTFLPDWNFAVSDARKQVIEDAVWLAIETGADGFRVDALKHMEEVFITELRQRVARELEQTGVRFYMVGETFTGDLGLIQHYVGPSMLHGQFDFPSNMAIRKGLATDELGLDQMHQWVQSNKAAYGQDAPFMSTFVGNHDIARFVSKASGDLPCGVWSVGADVSRAHDSPPGQPSEAWPYQRLQLALTYAYSVPGIPLLYYGDEVGLAGAGDPDNRRMLPGDGELNAHQLATRSFVQRLGQTRAQHPVLRAAGASQALFADPWLLVFARSLGNERALVVLNRGGDRTVSVDVASLGMAEGATLEGGLHGGSVSVQGGSVSLFVPSLSSEIYLRQ